MKATGTSLKSLSNWPVRASFVGGASVVIAGAFVGIGALATFAYQLAGFAIGASDAAACCAWVLAMTLGRRVATPLSTGPTPVVSDERGEWRAGLATAAVFLAILMLVGGSMGHAIRQNVAGMWLAQPLWSTGCVIAAQSLVALGVSATVSRRLARRQRA